MQKNRSNYNDGVALLYRKKNASKNVKTMDDLDYVGKLAFGVKSIRQADMEFAMQQDKQLTLKVVTPDCGQMDTALNVLIEDTLYAIIHIDRNKNKRELYFYLTEVRKIDRGD